MVGDKVDNIKNFINNENMLYVIYDLINNTTIYSTDTISEYFPKEAPKYWKEFFNKCGFNSIYEDTELPNHSNSLYVFPICDKDNLIGYLVTLRLFDDNKVSYINGALKINSL